MSMTERFIQVRNHLDYNKAQFAELLETNPQGISDIETGRKKLNIEIAKQLYEKLQINLNWLISGAGSMKITVYKSVGKISKVHEEKGDYGDYKEKYIKSLESEVVNLKNINHLLVEICECGKRKDLGLLNKQ